MDIPNWDCELQKSALHDLKQVVETEKKTRLELASVNSELPVDPISRFLSDPEPWSPWSLRGTATSTADTMITEDEFMNSCHCDITPSPDLHQAQHSTSQSSSSRSPHTSQTKSASDPRVLATSVHHSSATTG